MIQKRTIATLIVTALLFGFLQAQKVDYSIVSVPEETGIELRQVGTPNDYVCMPLVKRTTTRINWISNRIIAISPDGNNIAYLSYRNNTTNIFIKDIAKQGSSIQRTKRSNVLDFSFSPDGKFISLSATEWRSISLHRTNADDKSEIWKINATTGVEECIISDIEHSFTSPMLSPDGKWILLTGSSKIPRGNSNYLNTDLFVARPDGTNLLQLTYHAADDLSPVWSKDGKYIYFISQRGDANGTANIWRINFNY